jgi:hypothetical protein
MHFAVATYLTTANPENTASFLKDALNFQIEYRPGYGWWVENGSVTIILQAGNANNSNIEIQCTHIEKDSQHLLQHPDIQAITTIQQHNNRIEQQLLCDCGIILRLSKVLNEDEMGELLSLPSSLPWDKNTDLCTRRILRIAPLSFREKARERVTQRAEYIAVEAGSLMVQEAHAMQAFVEITLDFQYQALFDAMQQEGIHAITYMQDPS